MGSEECLRHRGRLLAQVGLTTGPHGASPAGACNPDQNGNAKAALRDPPFPTGGPRRLPPQPPSRLSLGRRRELRSPSPGHACEASSEGSDHDYLPLVRTREVEGSVARARALSQLASPPTSSLLRCGCRRRQGPSAWTRPSAQRCAFHRSACAEPRPSQRTAPASAPPRPRLPGHFWALVLARETVPQPPAAHPPARAPRGQARWTVGEAQTLKPPRGQEG